MEGVYKVSVVKLNRLLFGENSEFWTAFNEKQKITDFVQGPWQKVSVAKPQLFKQL